MSSRGDGHLTATSRSTTVPKGPALINLALCAVAIVVAFVGLATVSLAAYCIVVVLGAVLIGWQRHLAVLSQAVGASVTQRWVVAPSRRLSMHPVEQAAVGAVLIAAMANAWVFAMEVARWAWAR